MPLIFLGIAMLASAGVTAYGQIKSAQILKDKDTSISMPDITDLAKKFLPSNSKAVEEAK